MKRPHLAQVSTVIGSLIAGAALALAAFTQFGERFWPSAEAGITAVSFSLPEGPGTPDEPGWAATQLTRYLEQLDQCQSHVVISLRNRRAAAIESVRLVVPVYARGRVRHEGAGWEEVAGEWAKDADVVPIDVGPLQPGESTVFEFWSNADPATYRAAGVRLTHSRGTGAVQWQQSDSRAVWAVAALLLLLGVETAGLWQSRRREAALRRIVGERLTALEQTIGAQQSMLSQTLQRRTSRSAADT